MLWPQPLLFISVAKKQDSWKSIYLAEFLSILLFMGTKGQHRRPPAPPPKKKPLTVRQILRCKRKAPGKTWPMKEMYPPDIWSPFGEMWKVRFLAMFYSHEVIMLTWKAQLRNEVETVRQTKRGGGRDNKERTSPKTDGSIVETSGACTIFWPNEPQMSFWLVSFHGSTLSPSRDWSY